MGTALIYDEEMTNYKLLWVDPACEVEVPERLKVCAEALKRTGLADRCVSVPVREATDADILLAHSEEYLEAVKKTPYMTLGDLMEFTLQYGDVYFHPNIYHCAKLAAGAALQLVDSVMTGAVRNGMALVRPPGHHSMRSAANGFCVFNNVAIAARYAKQKYSLQRVLIVDWDVHHGQGVQYCFEDDPSVLYFSWHRYEHQKFWPHLKESDYDHVAELPTSEISSKCAKLAKKTKKTAEGKTAKEEEVWPEPQKRVCPPIRVALILPDGVNCPEGCQRFSSTEDLDSVTVNKLSLFALVDKMEKKEGYSDVSRFMHAVLSLLLPLGYEYNPELVLLVRMPGCEMCDSLWQQLIGLLQGLAQGHTLILMQVRRGREFITNISSCTLSPLKQQLMIIFVNVIIMLIKAVLSAHI
ncbi:unnamed protein product [Tetraodon nigroviridis]|uniref:(spotted green pufferfish) hypothetical protein n=1 Tax=Tetraodon nigroviridis TaxID=99883 RepID=Q4RSK1_TETNG|nr:unnamed protein product [Tetraodon nigroviridis]